MLHHIVVTNQGWCLICKVRKMLQGNVEVLAIDQVPFIESPDHSDKFLKNF